MKLFAFLSFGIAIVFVAGSAFAETVDDTNRPRFSIGSAFRNDVQSLCKGGRMTPGQLEGAEVSGLGEWTSYAALIRQTPSSAAKARLATKAEKAVSRCQTEKTRAVFRPILDDFWWLDTMGSNSLEQDDSLYFFEEDESGAPALHTDSTVTNIHSHYLGFLGAVTERKALVYTGQLRISDVSGGIGVTFLSDYPNSDSYYRLRRLAGESLHIAPHPDQSEFPELLGTIDSGVTPVPGTWYNFEIRTFIESTGTTILAKVWAEGDTKPTDWQIDATDTSVARFTTGRVGVWSMADGRKSWRNLKVKLVRQRPRLTILE